MLGLVVSLKMRAISQFQDTKTKRIEFKKREEE
jgi:hypothetical protein